jgi:hypothetical protein
MKGLEIRIFQPILFVKVEVGLFGRITEDGLLKGEIMKREYHEPVLINKIGVKLINEYGEVVNMNNMDYTFGIEFEMVE